MTISQVRGPYRDQLGYRVRWREDGRARTRQLRSVEAAAELVAQLRGDAPAGPPATAPPLHQPAPVAAESHAPPTPPLVASRPAVPPPAPPPPPVAPRRDAVQLPGHAAWAHTLTDALADAQRIGDVAQRSRIIATLATAARPYLDQAALERGIARARAVLDQIAAEPIDEPAVWAVRVSAHLARLLASAPDNPSLATCARSIKAQVDSVITATRNADLEREVVELHRMVTEWQAQAEHGTSFLGADAIAERNRDVELQ